MPAILNSAIRLVLASSSITRRRLLISAGLPVEVIPPDLDERLIEAEQKTNEPAALALSLAKAKALSVSQATGGALVVGADQVLSFDRRVFHKSANLEEGLSTLKALSGRTHCLVSAFAIARDGQLMAADVDVAEMTMRALDETALRVYLEVVGSGVLSSVGAYQWEGMGVHLFSRVVGEHTTVLGLPMLKLLPALRALGALKF